MKPGTAGANVYTAVNITTKQNFVGSAKQTKEVKQKEPTRQKTKRHQRKRRRPRKLWNTRTQGEKAMMGIQKIQTFQKKTLQRRDRSVKAEPPGQDL